MALPPLTPEQRAAALEKAAAARRERAEVKNRLKYSGVPSPRSSRRARQRRHRQDEGLGPARVPARRRQGPGPPDHGGDRHLREPPRPGSRARTRSPRSLERFGPTRRAPRSPLHPPADRPRRTHRRRQGHGRQPRPPALPRGLALGLGDHPAPRPGEVDGVHYHFVADAEFDRMVAAGELLEWAVLHGRHRYGTPRRPVEERARGRPAGAARDRPAGRAPGPRVHAGRAVRVPAPPTLGGAGAAAGRAGDRGRGRARAPAGHRPGRAGRRGGVRRDHRERRRLGPRGRRNSYQ